MRAKVLRHATETDIPLVRAIALATWPVAYRGILSSAQLAYMLDLMYSGTALTDQLTRRGHQFLLASDLDGPVGFAAFEHHHMGERSARLHKLYVLPATQGTGVGSALLEGVERSCLAAGDQRLELNVNRFNKARNWYVQRGFRVAYDEVVPIGNGFVMDDHVMTKDL